MKKKKDESMMTPEELARRELIRKRCLIVLIVFDIIVLGYLIAQMITVFMSK